MAEENKILNLFNEDELNSIEDKELVSQIKYIKENIINIHREFFIKYGNKVLELAKAQAKLAQQDFKNTTGDESDYYEPKNIEKIFNKCNNFNDIMYIDGSYSIDNKKGNIIYAIEDHCDQEDYFILMSNETICIYIKFIDDKLKEVNINRVIGINVDDECFVVYISIK